VTNATNLLRDREQNQNELIKKMLSTEQGGAVMEELMGKKWVKTMQMEMIEDEDDGMDEDE
jgi:hypothetical protein